MTVRKMLRLYWFEVRQRTYFFTYRPPRVVPCYIGPVSYDRVRGWAGSWRGANGLEVGVAGRHALAFFDVPGPGNWMRHPARTLRWHR